MAEVQKQEEKQEKKRLNGKSIKVALNIFKYLKPYRLMFRFGILFLLLSGLTTMTFPYVMGKLIDSAKGNNTVAWMNNTNTMALVLMGILLVQAVMSYVRVYIFATVSERAMADVRTTLFDKIISLPISFFEKTRVGEITSRSTNDVDQLQDMLSATLPEFVRQVVTIIFGVGFIFYISPQLTLLMLATFPVLVLVAVFYGKYIRGLSKDRQKALAETNIIVEESLQNIHTVKSFTNEKHTSGKYMMNMAEVVRTGIRGAVNRGGFTTFLILGLFGGFVLVIWYGTTLMKQGSIYEGELFSFVLYTGFIGGAVGGLGDLYGRLQKTVGASERIFEMLGEESETDIHAQHEHKPKLLGEITFEKVQFAYPTRPDAIILNSMNLHIRPGEKIALAGHSGAGKSTVAQLILQFYQPQSGEIFMDGKPAKVYPVQELRANMAVVPQEVLLFGGSIRENIAYGKITATEAEIIEAAKKAHAWEFIARFPDGLETIVGERGIKLSGGQRQRIAIARAILKDPAILILDEATSSLDAESEKLVQEALEILMEGRTTIIIAHRLSTIRNVDRILVIQDGVVAEEGSYNTLSAKPGGIFQKLLQLQYRDAVETRYEHKE